MPEETATVFTKRQESLRDGVTSRLSRLGTFATSVLVLLLLLFGVVEQQISEYEKEIADAGRARARAGMKLAASHHALKSLRRSFLNLVPRQQRLSTKTTQSFGQQSVENMLEKAETDLIRESMEESMEPVTPRHIPGQIDAVPATTAIVSDDSDTASAASQSTEPSSDEFLYEKALSARFLNNGQNWEQKLLLFGKAEEQLRAQAERASRSTRRVGAFVDEAKLAQAIRILQEYEDNVRTEMLQRASVSIAAERIRNVRATKQSIPTPFGSFQIDPRLALVGMALASLIAYFFFNLSARTARTMAQELAQSLGQSERCRYAVATPSWFFVGSNSVREIAIRPSTSTAAAARLHAAWLLLALAICFESWRLGAASSLLIGHSYAMYVVLAAALLVAVALAVDFLHPRPAVIWHEQLPRLMAVRVSRRQAIAVAVISTSVVVAGSVLRRWPRKGRPLPNALRAKEVSVPIYPNTPVAIDVDGEESLLSREKERKWKLNLTAHAHTGVVHHIEICSHHLPKPRNRTPAPAGGVVHRGWEAAILYRASMEIENLNRLTFAGYHNRAYAEQLKAMRFRSEEVGAPRPTRTSARRRLEAATIEASEIRKEGEKFRQGVPKNFAGSPLGAINRHRDSKIIDMLLHAIEIQPWSFHLHHRLIRVYGRLERFDAIRTLIDRSRRLAAEAVRRSPRAADIAKAKREFDSWPAKLELRRVASAKKKQEKEKEEERLKSLPVNYGLL